MDEKAIKMVNEIRWVDGLKLRSRLEDITYNPMRSQEEFVMRMMRENSKTVYGRKYGFKSIRNLDDFRRCIPLTTYDDYISYVERVANGEKNVLTAYLTEYISQLDVIRMLPQTRWSVQASYDYSLCSGFYLAGRHGYLMEGMTLNLVDDSVEQLPSGLTVGNLIGRLLVKRDFDNEQVYVIPVDGSAPSNRGNDISLQALYALRHKNISLVICERYEYMLELLRYIEKHWPSLAEDIERGNQYVQADPKRAAVIREVMEFHNIGTQLVELLWPGFIA